MSKVQTATVGFVAKEIFVSNAALEIVENFLDVEAISFFAILGIVTNIIIIAVFSVQGFHDSVSISLTAMAVWELFKCVVGLAMRVYGPLGWVSPVYRKTWKNISTPTLNYLQVFANYVTYIMAAYVAFERCMCVTMPFRVKAIFVPRLTLVMMVTISVVVILSFGIIFFVYDIYWVVDPAFNQTVIVYTYNGFYLKYGSGVIEYFTYIGFLNPVFSFVVIFFCTVIIFYQLHKMSSFRSKSTLKEKDMSSRDKQVVKMLLVVIIVYIAALMPRFLLHAGKMVDQEFYYLRNYHNLFNVCAYIVMTVDFINASVHLFIYLSMSTNFRATFFNLFPWCKRR